jgi:uncharacterized membrane protein
MAPAEIRPPVAEPDDDRLRLDSDQAVTWKAVTLLLLIVLLGGLLRVVQLGREGLWADECATAVWSQLPPPMVTDVTRSDNHAPLYFLAEGAVVRSVGGSETSVRALSVVTGTATIAIVFCIARLLVSTMTGLIAALLLATSPMHVYYSQEARCYSLLTMLVAMTLLSMLWLRRRPTPYRAMIAAALGLMVLYTHPVGAFFLVGIYAAVAIDSSGQPRLLRMGTLAAALTILGYLPWLASTLRQVARLDASYAWMQSNWSNEFPWQIVRSLAALSHGSLAPIRNHVVNLIPSAWIGAGLIAALGAALFITPSPRDRRIAGLRLVIASLVPLVGIFVYSWVATPIYAVGRIDSPSLPFVVVLVAAAALQLGPRIAALAMVAFLGLSILPFQIHWTIDFKSQEKGIATILKRNLGPGDIVVASAYSRCLEYYAPLVAGRNLIVFPPRPNPYSDWSPISSADAAALTTAAHDVVSSLPTLPPGGKIWTLTLDDRIGNALADELSRHHPLLGTRDLGYRTARLDAYLGEASVTEEQP